MRERHEAILIEIGFEVPYSIGITGEEAEGSIQAVDYLRDINSGKHVEIASTLYLNGFEQVGKILEKLVSWMDKRNYAMLDDFKGHLSYKGGEYEEQYERTQFMKNFGDHNPE